MVAIVMDNGVNLRGCHASMLLAGIQKWCQLKACWH